jgi:hypothetical protein
MKLLGWRMIEVSFGWSDDAMLQFDVMPLRRRGGFEAVWSSLSEAEISCCWWLIMKWMGMRLMRDGTVPYRQLATLLLCFWGGMLSRSHCQLGKTT